MLGEALGFSRCLGNAVGKERLGEAGVKRGSKIMEALVCYPSQFCEQWEATERFLSTRAAG